MILPGLIGGQSEQKQGAARSDHAYAIVRIDDFLGPQSPIENRITVKKIMWDADAADREVERLNGLKNATGIRYFSQITRVDRRHSNQVENRISGLYAPASEEPKKQGLPSNSKWLETIRVAENIWLPLPKGLSFPASRALEVCAHPDSCHQVSWSEIEIFILTKKGEDYLDVVSLQKLEVFNLIGFAFRIYSDMIDVPLGDLTPLEAVNAIADRYGYHVQIGQERGKFFLESSIPLPRGVASGPPSELVKVEDPGENGMLLFTLVYLPPAVRIALGFALNTMKFKEAIRGR
jgi:hypothetical protein